MISFSINHRHDDRASYLNVRFWTLYQLTDIGLPDYMATICEKYKIRV